MSKNPVQHVWSMAHALGAFPTVGKAHSRPSGREKSVVVIGAGLAGLHAAYLLSSWGHEVTVLEAKSIPGGRVHTIREPFAGGQHAEAGATLFPGHHNLTIGYCVLFKLPMVMADPDEDRIGYYVKKQHIRDPMNPAARWPYRLHKSEKGLPGIVNKYLLSKLKEVGDPRSKGWPSPTLLAKYDRVSVAEMMKRDGASDGAVELMSLGYLKETGNGSASLSALSVLEDMALSAGGRPSPRIPPGLGDQKFGLDCSAPSFAVAGGNDLLPAAFAESAQLQGKVRYEHAVTSVGDGKTGLRVHCATPMGNRSFRADRVIFAIPFPVLRDKVRIKLKLSAGKQRAIQELASTPVTRVYVQTRTRSWGGLTGAGTVNTDLPVGIANDQTLAQRGERGIMEALMAGAEAEHMDSLSERQRIRQVTEQMREIFPGFDPIPGRHATKSWTADPWALGDYCWYKPGQMAELLPYVARPEPPLHFAGDQTSQLTSWAQGALESGLRAAQEVHRAR